MTSLVALLACHDRREQTVACLRSLFAAVPFDVALSAVLVDDGSSDGTCEAVAELGLPIEIVAGDGSWFWSRSMAVAERVAERSDPDWVLWLNDDVTLFSDALLQWRMATRLRPDDILVGGLHSPHLGCVGYSGFDWARRSSLTTVTLRPPNGELQRTEGFHGNFVAVPRTARRRIGPIDGTWAHNGADLDYALRADAADVHVWVLPRTVGECDPVKPAWMESETSVRMRLRSIFGRTGWPVRHHWRLHRRHGTGAWPVRAWAPHWRALVGPRRPRHSDGGRNGPTTGGRASTS